MVDGQGFPEGLEIGLSFAPSNEPAHDAIFAERVSDTRLKLSLAEGHSWAPQGGPLFLLAATFGETKVSCVRIESQCLVFKVHSHWPPTWRWCTGRVFPSKTYGANA